MKKTTNKPIAVLRLHSLHRCLWLLGALLLAGNPAQAANLQGGDILVVDAIGGMNASGALFVVNPVTGKRSILSDFGSSAQGPLGSGDLTGVAVRRNGRIYVSSLFSGSGGNGALFKVDPETGNRTLVSDFGQGSLQGFLANGLAEEASGRVWANLNGSTPPFPFSVIRVDPKTDNRVLVSDFTNPAQGETGQYISDLALEESPKAMIIIGTELTFGTHAAIFDVNTDTGERTLVSDFANPAQGTDVADLSFRTGLAETGDRILVNSGDDAFAPRNLLLSIDPATGNRTVLSDFDNPAQGPSGTALAGLGVEKSGNVLVGAGNDVTGAQMLFRVDSRTGTRAVLSDSSNPAQGAPFIGVTYLAIVSAR